MTESQRTQIPSRRKSRKQTEEAAGPVSSPVSEEEQKKKLKELDEFMEGVLEKAGEEFLDEFRQVEGQ